MVQSKAPVKQVKNYVVCGYCRIKNTKWIWKDIKDEPRYLVWAFAKFNKKFKQLVVDSYLQQTFYADKIS